MASIMGNVIDHKIKSFPQNTKQQKGQSEDWPKYLF